MEVEYGESDSRENTPARAEANVENDVIYSMEEGNSVEIEEDFERHVHFETEKRNYPTRKRAAINAYSGEREESDDSVEDADYKQPEEDVSEDDDSDYADEEKKDLRRKKSKEMKKENIMSPKSLMRSMCKRRSTKYSR